MMFFLFLVVSVGCTVPSRAFIQANPGSLSLRRLLPLSPSPQRLRGGLSGDDVALPCRTSSTLLFGGDRITRGDKKKLKMVRVKTKVILDEERRKELEEAKADLDRIEAEEEGLQPGEEKPQVANETATRVFSKYLSNIFNTVPWALPDLDPSMEKAMTEARQLDNSPLSKEEQVEFEEAEKQVGGVVRNFVLASVGGFAVFVFVAGGGATMFFGEEVGEASAKGIWKVENAILMYILCQTGLSIYKRQQEMTNTVGFGYDSDTRSTREAIEDALEKGHYEVEDVKTVEVVEDEEEEENEGDVRLSEEQLKVQNEWIEGARRSKKSIRAEAREQKRLQRKSGGVRISRAVELEELERRGMNEREDENEEELEFEKRLSVDGSESALNQKEPEREPTFALKEKRKV
uniref:Uncharacterized protein n=1 Tax=Chromera velia CCMP2878 TaxID=1169474 RepID=A0A0G4HXV9_9ALVE|eukprot:Cvel_9356.t1-p1 / transcript=Cvel_9356.t1 / gene=Cvel_9356 / organism=Chromera_velia_CCMP2878 / gene_product=hypothetical protein / transcript_product=hypothetical protein / location=Cvel_scaffold537:25069-27196(-) / protein_length=404 / sequence_SO=supercontig / SO=protein_coding / is_pseudo=false